MYFNGGCAELDEMTEYGWCSYEMRKLENAKDHFDMETNWYHTKSKDGYDNETKHTQSTAAAHMH